MKKIIFSVILTILFVILINSASAFTFVNIYVDETGGALFLGQTDETQLSLPEGIRIENGEIIGRTQELTGKTGELWTFSFTLNESEFNVILPRGAVITSLPADSEISLDGDRISIYVTNSITLKYELEEASDPSLANNIPLLVTFLALLVILIVFIVNYTKRDEKAKKDKDKLQNIEYLLNEREKLILKKLKETGKIKSSQLRKLTEIPKASFSRHAQELEKKKLISRTRRR